MNVAEALEAWQHQMPVGSECLLGVSGGRDSVVLLHAMVAMGWRPHVCHLDHGLRGDESTGDAAFVAELAGRYGLQLASERVSVAELMREEQLSVEVAARLARHRFFARCAERFGCGDVVLAHHAADQVETVLMQLFRGAAGLHGMAARVELPVDAALLTLHRPLLGVAARELDAWAKTQALSHRVDSSNAEASHLRNKLRLHIIPAIEEASGREIGGPLLRAITVSADEGEYLTRLAAPLVRVVLDVRELAGVDKALQRRVILGWLRLHAVPDCGFAEVERVRQLVEVRLGVARVNLPRGLRAGRSQMQIHLIKS